MFSNNSQWKSFGYGYALLLYIVIPYILFLDCGYILITVAIKLGAEFRLQVGGICLVVSILKLFLVDALKDLEIHSFVCLYLLGLG